MPDRDFDVLVLGAGAPGQYCAGVLAEGGLARVAVVERALVGGECFHAACIPSKTLLRSGEVVSAARSAAATAEVDVPAALAWRDVVVGHRTDEAQVEWLRGRGIGLLRGEGRLAGPGVVELEGMAHTTGEVVVATGSRPFVPPVPGLRGLDGVWGTGDATALTDVPRRLVVLGGGPAGVEMAQAIHRLGAEVVLVEAAEHVLPREPVALGAALGGELQRDGVELVLGAGVQEARREGAEFVLALDDGSSVRGDRLLVAAGRRPRVADIGLESVGIEADPLGIPVDNRMRAASEVWAIGDVTGILPLTHVGEYQAGVAAANILGEHRTASYDAVPRVVFTDPQAVAVGATSARFSGTAHLKDLARTATYSRDHRSEGFLTLLSDGERLTGGYALGPEAGEWLQQVTLAVRAQVPLGVLLDTVQPFPTFSQAVGVALKDMLDHLRSSNRSAG